VGGHETKTAGLKRPPYFFAAEENDVGRERSAIRWSDQFRGIPRNPDSRSWISLCAWDE
jgi:hypothetical protein